LYALFLALAYMNLRLRDRIIAYVNFLLVCAAFVVLTQALHMSTKWLVVVALLLLAYLVSPHLIWKLTRATHAQLHDGEPDRG